MAYSLGDSYRPLRTVLRINGVAIGLLLGVLLLVGSPALLRAIGLPGAETLFALRVAGVSLVGVGLFMLAAASAREIDLWHLIACLVFHALLAITLLLAWFRGDLQSLGVLGLTGLLVIFSLALVGALAPLRYFRAEYRM